MNSKASHARGQSYTGANSIPLESGVTRRRTRWNIPRACVTLRSGTSRITNVCNFAGRLSGTMRRSCVLFCANYFRIDRVGVSNKVERRSARESIVLGAACQSVTQSPKPTYLFLDMANFANKRMVHLLAASPVNDGEVTAMKCTATARPSSAIKTPQSDANAEYRRCSLISPR